MVDGSISKPFSVTTGVLQGDVLAPFLFIIILRLLIGRISVLLNSDWLRSIREKVKLACLVVKETTASLAGIIGEGTLFPK